MSRYRSTFPSPRKTSVVVPTACHLQPMPNAAAQARGFGVLEAIVGLTITMSLMGLGSRYLQRSIDSKLHQATAHHLKKIDQAANAYVRDHYAALSKAPTTELTIAMLVTAGYLPNNTLESNYYRQNYKIMVITGKQGEKELLQVAITTQDGQTIDEKALRQITNLVGGQAGYASVLSPNKITGSQEGWEMETSQLPLKVGHLATVNLVNQQDVLSADSFLRRKKFKGHPEYNKMETDLEIDEHSKIFFGEEDLKLSKDALTIGNRMTLDKRDLTFKDADGNYLLITSGGNKYIEIRNSPERMRLWGNCLTLLDDNKTREIELNNQQSPYISVKNGNVSSSLSSEELSINAAYNQGSSSLSPHELKFQNFLSTSTLSDSELSLSDLSGRDHVTVSLYSGVTAASHGGLGHKRVGAVSTNFVQIPMFAIGDVTNRHEVQRIADKLDCSNNTGRLFVVGDNISWEKRLCMCLWRPHDGVNSYFYVATGTPNDR